MSSRPSASSPSPPPSPQGAKMNRPTLLPLVHHPRAMFNSPAAHTPTKRSNRAAPRPSSSSSVASVTRSPRLGTPSRSPAPSTTARRPTRTNNKSILATASPVVDGDDDDAGQDRRVASATPSAGSILKHDGFSAVTLLSTLPRQVNEALQKADPYIDAVKGHLDVATGHALLVTATKTFVWTFSPQSSAPSHFTTCYTFASPSSAPSGLPHAALVPRSGNREPGLILVSLDGSIRFWDSVAASLAGQDRSSQHVDIVLGAAESVVALCRCEPTTYVIATSASRLFRLSLVSAGGRLQPHLSPFNQARGLFGRFFASAPASTMPGAEGLVGLAVCPPVADQGYRDIYAIGQRMVQKWRLVDGGGEKLLAEQDVATIIAEDMVPPSDNAAAQASHIDVNVLDGAARSDGSLSLLYSHATQPNKPLNYGIATLQCTAAFALAGIVSLDYRSLRDPRPYSSPHLIVPNGADMAFAAFPDVLVTTLLNGDHFEDHIALKDSARNRFLGFGFEGADVEAADAAVAPLSCLSAQSGALLVEVSVAAAKDFQERLGHPAERQAALNDRLQSRLEQAVFFDVAEVANPLSFAISQAQAGQGDLATAAEHISSSIVTSSSVYLETFVDVRAHLADRGARLAGLIDALRSNDLVSRLPLRTRCKLLADAQLLAAVTDLWQLHNQQLAAAGASASSSSSALANAIEDVMSASLGSVGGFGSDAVRAFFKSHAQSIVAVFERLQQRLAAATARSSNIEVRSREITAIDRVAITAFQAAQRLRQSGVAATKYGVTAAAEQTQADAMMTTVTETWTCKASSLALLEALYFATEALIRDRKRELGSRVDRVDQDDFVNDAGAAAGPSSLQLVLKTQLCELARYALLTYAERMSYLRHRDAHGDKERAAVEARYRSALPRMIGPLASLASRPDRAFQLAEQHGDYATLVQLCLDESTGDPAPRVEHYLRKYERPFAWDLYSSLVARGEVRELLRLGEGRWGQLLRDYLHAADDEREDGQEDDEGQEGGGGEDDAEAAQLASISWLHDISLGEFRSASSTLLRSALRAPHKQQHSLTTTSPPSALAERHLLLSLGKLAYIADLDEAAIATEGEQRAIERIDDALDLVSVHYRLREQLGSEDALAASVDALYQRGQEAYAAHLARLGRRIVDVGQDEGGSAGADTLGAEDLVDVLTLSSPPAGPDPLTALQVLVRTPATAGGAQPVSQQRLPAARRTESARSVLRRALLFDDWMGRIAHTRGRTEEQQRDVVASTQWYAVVSALTQDGAEMARDLFVDDAEGLEGALATEDGWAEWLEGQACAEPRKDVVAARFQRSGIDASLYLNDVDKDVEEVQALVSGNDDQDVALWIREAAKRARSAAAQDEGMEGASMQE